MMRFSRVGEIARANAICAWQRGNTQTAPDRSPAGHAGYAQDSTAPRAETISRPQIRLPLSDSR